MTPTPFAWGNDPELTATLHLLDTPLIAGRTHQFIDLEQRSIAWEQLLTAARAWSHGEHPLVRAAPDICNADGKTPLGELYLTLDEGSLRRVLQTLAIRRRMPPPYRDER